MNTTADKVNRPATPARQISRHVSRRGELCRSHDGGSFFRPARPFIQPKLEVSKPDDPHEREAESTAERVMRMPEPTAPTAAPAAPAHSSLPTDSPAEELQRQPEEEQEIAPKLESTISIIQRNEDGEEREVEVDRAAEPFASRLSPAAAHRIQSLSIGRMISRRSCSLFHSDVVQRAGRGPPSHEAGFESQLTQTRGTGQELPAETRSFMENRFQSDFSGVRVHTGGTAQSLSKSIHAQAFTHGGDIYFNSGKFDPDSSSGRTLLAHELTHTIQQGASPRLSSSLSRSPAVTTSGPVASRQILQRQTVPQLASAVGRAKAEEGKVNASLPGADSYRTGWQRLLEYFKTSMGEDKIVGAGSGYVEGTVPEQVIKTKSQAIGQVANQPPDVQAMRDAMPSWCGIFVFWALNKGGVPMPKWRLGGPAIKPEAAYPPGHKPRAGDIAYRQAFSHYAIVESATGGSESADVVTVNGNTAGEDNMGGQIQSRTHKLSNWTGFFNPLVMMEGSLRDVQDPDAKPKTLRELRKELFRVDRQEESTTEPELEEPTEVQTKSENTAPSNSETAPNQLQRAEKKENEPEEKEELESTAVLERMVQRLADPAQSPMRAHQTDPRVAPSSVRQNTTETAVNSDLISEREPPDVAALHSPESARGPPISVQNVAPMLQRSWLGDAWDAVSGFASEAAQWVEEGLDAAKRWLLRKVRDFVREIPGYKMLSFILAEDPITGEGVERTGRNLLYAGLDLMPAGDLFRTVIERIGIVNDLAAYLDARISDMSRLASGIADRFSRFWDSISLDDIGDPEGVFNRVADLLRSTIDDIVGFITRAATDFLDMIKQVMLREIVTFVRNQIPRLYPLLCVALGHDPVTNEEVARNGTNILNAILEVSEEGREQRRQMQETGSFQRIAGFIDRGIFVFTTAYHQLRAAFSSLWDLVTIEALVSPIETFNRIYDQFAAPVRLVTNYIVEVAIEILRVIKEVLMARLSAWARTVRGYHLVTVIIGRDPFTGQRVARNVENVIRGFMSLMDGGEEQFQQMKESGAIDRAAARIAAAVARLNMTPAYIINLFIGLWNSFSLRDLTNPIAAFRRIVNTFGQPIGRLIAFVIEIVKIVVEVILQVMNFPVDLISNIITRTLQAFELIKRDPIGFLKNLLRSIKQGFIQFFDNILTHLISGVTGWLMSELRDAGVPTLSDFSLRGVISWVLQVLGISMDKIWEKLAAHPRIGPARVAQIRSMIDRLEGIWTFIKDVQERGMAAIWDKIQEQLSNLWDTVLDAVKNWIMERIITAVVTKLLSMLDPTGIMAVINSAIAIYRAVQSFIRYITQMLQVVNSFVEGVVEIAQGNITRAANALEGAMGRAMPIVIGFLANQVGLGGVGQQIGEMIGRVREMVDRALTWLVNRAVDTGFALIERALALGRSAVAAVRGWVGRLLGLEKRFQDTAGGNHRLYFATQGETAVLMINPDPATNFVTWVTNINVGADQTKITAKNEAIIIAREIDAEKVEPAGANPGPAEEEKSRRIRGKLDELSRKVGPLLASEAPDCSSEANGGLVLGGLHNGKYGSTMAAVTLTNVKMPPGSAPSVSLHQSFNTINQRRNQGGSYYILGHLLNHNLGGTGRDWRNLTPLTRQANSAHERIAESRVKNAVTAGNIVRYSVQAVYGRTTTTNVDPTIQEIITHEVDVPTQLVCQAEMIVPASKSSTGLETTSWLVPAGTIIDNTIGQTPADYDLAGIRHEIVYLNSKEHTKIADLPGIGDTLATRIIDAHKKKGGRFSSFEALATYDFGTGVGFTQDEQNAIKALPNQVDYVRLYSAG